MGEGGMNMGNAGGMGGMDMGGGVMGMGGGMEMGATPATNLMQILTTSVMPQTWQGADGPGTVATYNGLLVVNQNPGIHRQIATVLDMLRKAAATQAGATVQAGRR